jgi:multidrug efflux pump subunit AcrA (membrane-fusion protein)
MIGGSSAKTATVWVLSVLFAGVIAWASLVDLDYGVHALGTVSNRFASIPVQHSLTAKVVTISVREGQRVRTGDLLVVLDDSEARADFGRAELQLKTLKLQLDQLRAELDGSSHFPRPGLVSESASSAILEKSRDKD